jgi:hypothetical protein
MANITKYVAIASTFEAYTHRNGQRLGAPLGRVVFLIVVAAILATSAGTAVAAEVRGNSTTIPYYYEESIRGEDYSYLALYEFADVAGYDLGTPGLDCYIAGWGRFDTMDKMDLEDEATGDGDLSSAYVRWRHPDQWLDLSLGRQFVYMGPVGERIDSLQMKFEPLKGIGIQGFGGVPVITEEYDRSGDLGYGGRVYGGWRPWFEVGVSAASFLEKEDPDREIAGVDLTVFPARWVDILGHAYYEALFGEVYDAEGMLIFRPVTDLKVLASYQSLMPVAFLGRQSLFSVFSFNKINKANAEVNYTFKRRVTVSAEYDLYTYDEGDPASRYGGSAGLLWGAFRDSSFEIGAFRLDREDNGYNEFRGFLYQNITTKLYGVVDAIAYQLDEEIYQADDGFYGSASAGWRLTEDLDIQASGFYQTSPYYEQDVRGLLKVAWNFKAGF